jgi:hypothetical protein
MLFNFQINFRSGEQSWERRRECPVIRKITEREWMGGSVARHRLSISSLSLYCTRGIFFIYYTGGKRTATHRACVIVVRHRRACACVWVCVCACVIRVNVVNLFSFFSCLVVLIPYFFKYKKRHLEYTEERRLSGLEENQAKILK